MKRDSLPVGVWHPSRAAVRRAGVGLIVAALLAACGADRRERVSAMTGGGVPEHGRATIQAVGCGSCHTIPGVAGANALVGPPLTGFASRQYIGGVLPNTPDNLVAWLLDPRRHSPKTVMPDVGLEEREARDVAAYLYLLEAD